MRKHFLIRLMVGQILLSMMAHYVPAKTNGEPIESPSSTNKIENFTYIDADFRDIAKSMAKLFGKELLTGTETAIRVTLNESRQPLSVAEAWTLVQAEGKKHGLRLALQDRYMRLYKERKDYVRTMLSVDALRDHSVSDIVRDLFPDLQIEPVGDRFSVSGYEPTIVELISLLKVLKSEETQERKPGSAEQLVSQIAIGIEAPDGKITKMMLKEYKGEDLPLPGSKWRCFISEASVVGTKRAVRLPLKCYLRKDKNIGVLVPLDILADIPGEYTATLQLIRDTKKRDYRITLFALVN